MIPVTGIGAGLRAPGSSAFWRRGQSSSAGEVAELPYSGGVRRTKQHQAWPLPLPSWQLPLRFTTTGLKPQLVFVLLRLKNGVGPPISLRPFQAVNVAGGSVPEATAHAMAALRFPDLEVSVSATPVGPLTWPEFAVAAVAALFVLVTLGVAIFFLRRR